jgi:hypothetical protein
MALGKFFGALVGFGALVCPAAAAEAGTLYIKDTSYRDGVGGEFNITGFDDPIAPPALAVKNGLTSGDVGNFKTFCLEKSEHISLGEDYTYTIDKVAKNGGYSGADSSLGGDPISVATAKIYYAFYTGQLTGYDYTDNAGRGQAGLDLQHVIWRLEGELTDSQWNTYMSAHQDAEDWYDLAFDLTWSELGQSWSDTDIGAVRVINLYDGTVAKQSQLAVVPLPPTAVMGLVLLAGVGGVMGLRRRILARRLF